MLITPSKLSALLISYRFCLVLSILFIGTSAQGQNCGNSWLNVINEITGVQIGDLDITGNKLTIEAKVTRTQVYDPSFKGGDIVSKHSDPSDDNYLLRANGAEITTSNGFFATPKVCDIELNKTYHIALVYDGNTLKFYRNGYLLSQIVCSGNLVTNDWPTAIGTTGDVSSPYPADFLGYIDEVRIWNVARTQNQLRTYMNKSLPNPTGQTGLLAYYTFNSLQNKQGNNAWNGSLLGTASINNFNPKCASFIADSCSFIINPTPIVNANFSIPDTVCINEPVNIKNLTTGGTNFYWNFCVADINQTPVGTNLGNLGGQLKIPVFMDFAQDDNGDYYGFSINHIPGEVIRYKFGNSLLNNPVVENLGNYGDDIPNQAEGVQIVKSNGSWYVVVVGGGDILTNSSPRIVVINFGSTLGINSQTAHNWGNIGNLSQPIDLHVFNEANHWYGFTVNATNNTITRFDFSNDLDAMPTATNLGDFGMLDYPDGIYAINDNSFWRVFITNGVGNTLTRLDFGSSLLNTPVAVDLGNPGNTLITPRDMLAIKFCGSYTGFVVNANTDEIIKLDFGTGFDQKPTAASLGNIANFDKPHSLSKLFRVEQDIYSFITNADNNSITRLKFSGCTNSSVPNSSDSIPPPITYNIPGIYNINLMVDEGLSTQTSVCKSITVVSPPIKIPIVDTALCNADSLVLTTSLPSPYTWNNGTKNSNISAKQPGVYWVETSYYGCVVRDSINIIQSPIVNLGSDTAICGLDSILLNAGNTGAKYLWNNGTNDSNILVKQPGIYWVEIESYGCVVRDTVNIIQSSTPIVNLGNDTAICRLDSLLLNAGNAGAKYLWNTGSKSQTIYIDSVGTYIVHVTNAEGCMSSDSLKLTNHASMQLKVSNDTTVCIGSNLILQANGNNVQTYSWSPVGTLSDPAIKNPVASPTDTTKYFLNVTDIYGCKENDSVLVNVASLPTVTTMPDTSICAGSSLTLSTNGTQGVSYLWSPSNGLSSNTSATPVASPTDTTKYIITVKTAAGCKAVDSVAIAVNALPTVVAGVSDSLICIGSSTTVTAISPTVVSYKWFPSTGLSDANIALPMATPNSTTTYVVEGTDINGCKIKDSVKVAVKQLPEFTINPPSAGVCKGEAVTLTASGGDEYAWYPPANLSVTDKAVTIATPTVSTTYKAVITDNICKITDSVFTTVSITSLSNINVTKSNDIDCIIGTTTLRATGGAVYNWTPGNYLSDSTISSPVAAPLQTTTYYVRVSNALGCTGTDSIKVNVLKGSVENGYKLPSAFTPNGDGNNDCFNVRKWGTLTALDFSVYDRWGNLVFHTTNASDCWDGTNKGQKQPPGAYVYQIRAQALCGTVYRKGTVVLIR